MNLYTNLQMQLLAELQRCEAVDDTLGQQPNHCVAVCCSVLQCVAVCCCVLPCCCEQRLLLTLGGDSSKGHDAVGCNVLQCVAVVQCDAALL